MFAFDLGGRVALPVQPRRAHRAVLRREADRPLAVRLRAQGDPRQPAARDRDRHRAERAARDRLYDLRGVCRHGRRTARADHRLRVARRARFPSLGRRAARARHRRRGLAVRRRDRRRRVQAAARLPVGDHAAVLAGPDRPRAGRAGAGRTRAARSRVPRAAAGSLARRGRSRERSRSGPANPRPAEALRRHRRDAGRVDRAGARRAAGADRSERRGQDHAGESAHRHAGADVGNDPARRRRHHAPAGAPARAARAGAHVPDQPAVRHADAARDAVAGRRAARGRGVAPVRAACTAQRVRGRGARRCCNACIWAT